MIAEIYLDEKGLDDNFEKLDSFNLPIKNDDLNKRIDQWRGYKLDFDLANHNTYSGFFIEIKDDILYGKIIVYEFETVNKVYFLYNILKEHNLINEFNMYWKYHSRSDRRELNSDEFYVVLKNILCKNYPGYQDEILNENFNDKSFLTKIPNTEEYIYIRQNNICKFLKEKTGCDWGYFDPAITYLGYGYLNETSFFQPDTYYSIYYDPDIPTEILKDEQAKIRYYDGKYKIKVANNIFKVTVETRIFNKIRDAKDNCDLFLYMDTLNLRGLSFTAIAYSWDEVFAFIKRVNEFEHNIRVKNNFIDNMNEYLENEVQFCNNDNSFDLEIKRINKELQNKVNKKLSKLIELRDQD